MSESGIFYKLDASGQIVDSVALTPEPVETLSGHVARAANGAAIVTYAGKVHVIVSSDRPVGPPIVRPMTPRSLAARAAKAAALARVPEPAPL